MGSLHDFSTKTIEGKDKSLSEYRGRALLVVNVASRCGLTPQYAGLEALHKKYQDRGLSVLGFPCNQFAGQEPGTEADIKSFCETKFGVDFDLFSKIDVNGKDRHPLYQFLAGPDAKFPGDITWNFEKFLVGKNGEVLERFSPKVTPEDPALVAKVESALG